MLETLTPRSQAYRVLLRRATAERKRDPASSSRHLRDAFESAGLAMLGLYLNPTPAFPSSHTPEAPRPPKIQTLTPEPWHIGRPKHVNHRSRFKECPKEP